MPSAASSTALSPNRLSPPIAQAPANAPWATAGYRVRNWG